MCAMKPATIGASAAPRLMAQYMYPKARVLEASGTRSVTAAFTAGRYRSVKNPRIIVRAAMSARSWASPRAAMRGGAPRRLIKRTGRLPSLSVSSPPASCAANEPAPKSDTIRPAWLTGMPRCEVRYRLRNGITKPPRRFTIVPSHRNQKAGGRSAAKSANRERNPDIRRSIPENRLGPRDLACRAPGAA